MRGCRDSARMRTRGRLGGAKVSVDREHMKELARLSAEVRRANRKSGTPGQRARARVDRCVAKIGLTDEMLLELTEEARRTGFAKSKLIRMAWKIARATIRAAESPPETLLARKR